MNMEVLAFVIYFAVVLGIGIAFFLRSKTAGEKEFFLGGRKMGPWVTAMSAQASDMSAWLLMGLPGSIMAFGFGQMWIGIGLALGTIANWLIVARRLRCFSIAADDSITIPQYLSNRFLSKSRSLQVVSAVIFLVCFTVYVASGFVAGANVFTAVFPSLSEQTAMLIFAVIIIVYTFLGGYHAVCWTDFVQGLLMLAALLAVPIMILATKGLDFSAVSDVFVNAEDGTRYAFGESLFKAGWKEIVSGLAWGLGYFGMPHILVRFMGIEKTSMVKKSSAVAIVWVVLALAATCAVAYFGRILIAEELLLSGQQKMVFIVLSRKLFPPIVSGFLLAAIVAASMSTADSQLLVASSSFSSDIYRSVFRKNCSDKEMIWVGRGVVIAVSLIAYFIASSEGSGAQAIMNLVENAWGCFGAAFGPVIILSLFWKRFTAKGAVAGIVGGAVTDVFWLLVLSERTGLYELLPGFAAGLICALAVSLLDEKPDDAVVSLYERAVKELSE